VSERDRRKHSRKAVDLPVEIVLGSGERFSARLDQMSIGGCFIETQQIQEFGSAIRLLFRLPGRLPEFALGAIVRWCAPTGMGVQFGTMGARETYELSEFLSDKPSIPPPPADDRRAAQPGPARPQAAFPAAARAAAAAAPPHTARVVAGRTTPRPGRVAMTGSGARLAQPPTPVPPAVALTPLRPPSPTAPVLGALVHEAERAEQADKLAKLEAELAQLTADQRARGAIRERLEAELALRNEKLTHTQAELALRGDKLAQLEAELAASSDKVVHLEAVLAASSEKLTQLEAELALRNDKLAQVDAQLAAQGNQAHARSADRRQADTGPVPPGDDFTRIKGIGPAFDKALKRLGICSYQQVAAWTEADIEDVSHKLKIAASRIRRNDWVRRATELVAPHEAVREACAKRGQG